MSVKKCGTDKTNNLSKCSATSADFYKESDHFSLLPNEDQKNITISFLVKGMTCMSFVHKVESVLSKYPGVTDAVVELSEQKATVHFNTLKPNLDDLKRAISANGYSILESDASSTEITHESQGQLSNQTFNVKPYIFGVTAAVGVIGFYLGLLTLVSDWYNATSQFAQYWGWIIALATGLGVQTTLFTHIKGQLKGKTTTAAKSSLAASGGLSTASMAACCAHYLVAFLPAFGLPFFSAAAAGLAEYQMEFFFLGVISIIFGIVVMIQTMNKNGLIPPGALARSLTIGL
jgi:cation transport ATPase